MFQAQPFRQCTILQGSGQLVRQVEKPVADMAPVMAPVEKVPEGLARRRFKSVPILLRSPPACQPAQPARSSHTLPRRRNSWCLGRDDAEPYLAEQARIVSQ